jgi:hypothetical protein
MAIAARPARDVNLARIQRLAEQIRAQKETPLPLLERDPLERDPQSSFLPKDQPLNDISTSEF